MATKNRLAPPRITGRKVKKNLTKHAHTTITESDAEFLAAIGMPLAALIRFGVKILKQKKEMYELYNKIYSVKELDKAINLKNKQHD